jgi:hypothetical protein
MHEGTHDPVSAAPQQEYTRRLRLHEQRESSLQATHLRTGYLRLALAILFLVTAWFTIFQRTIFQHDLPRSLIAVPILLFIAAGIFHARALRRLSTARRSVQVYRDGLARVEDRWFNLNPRDLTTLSTATAAALKSSLYATDLDIVGSNSLFELLCTARTRMGEDTLLTWLLEPASTTVILQRQAAITELRERIDLRERMSVAGDATVVGVHAEALRTWAVAPDTLQQRWLPFLAALLALAATAAAVAWFGSAGNSALLALLVILILEAALRKPFKSHIDDVLLHTDIALKNLHLLSALMAELECETFTAPLLLDIQQRLSSHSTRGSVAIARLATLGQLRDSMDNMIVKLIDLPLMYSVQVAFAVQRWRRRHGAAVPLWLSAIAEIEALLSLATYSYEHPADPFPDLLDGPSCITASAVGHPLIPASKCVRNSLELGPQPNRPDIRVLLISGSNMSGKSTLMRTLGVNAVLAMCGAPVRAQRLSLTPLRIGASLLVNDSLHEGHSRFYAEIDRLQRICTLAEGLRQTEASGGPEANNPGVLFLLDELLQGTNSADRLIGAQGVIRALIEQGAIGIVTTHDLALAEMHGLPPNTLKNMHFQDQIVANQMHFDFTLREGAAMRSNGVALMRLIGLNV